MVNVSKSLAKLILNLKNIVTNKSHNELFGSSLLAEGMLYANYTNLNTNLINQTKKMQFKYPMV